MSPSVLRDVYITGTGAFLPGDPVGGDAMENFIGRIAGRSSAVGRRALRWNGVETRHYALTPDGRPLHSNASMTAAATQAALDDAGLSVGDLKHLATATTQGDYIVPGHASAVHAELGAGPIEIASYQSVCASALMAAKGAWLQVRAGEAEVAAAAAGEFSSRWFRPEFYEGTSGRFDPCMWAGSTFADRADMKSAWSHAGPVAAHASGSVALVQDFELLKIVIRAWIGVWLEKVDQGRIIPDDVDHLLCHYSARSLREEIVSVLKSTAAMIPEEKWFSNLPTVGNIGAASIWVMLDEFMKSGRAKKGEKVLLIVPESGRAMVGFMMCEVV